ncbi:ribokinase [Providencia rettgeri]|uniref:ribokinase n=1 Tax=Providencia rettgeri TaxID=587 RepID=UPI0034E05A06
MVGKVCVFGSFNFDMVARVSRFPFPGESLVANSSMTSAGGKGANQATAALKSGANVHYIGKIGEDAFGQYARRHLKSVGFNAVTLLVTNEISTGNSLVYVAECDGDAENMIAVDPGANMTVTDDEITQCEPTISCADVVLVQLENNLQAIERVIAIGKANNAFVILNPAPWQPVTNEMLQQVDLITPNSTEAWLITGCKVEDYESASQAADLIHKKGCRNVIITMGSLGALLSDDEGKMVIPCFPSQPIDTTGAGDAFNGALAARLAMGDSIRLATRFASAYAAVSVEKLGAGTLPDLSEVEQRLFVQPI